MRDATVDVADWIRAQYAAIESAARLATPGPWHVSSQGRGTLQDWYVSSPHSLVLTGNHECGDDFLMVEYDRRDAEHVALHDPRFVLADLRSKRQLLAGHHPAPDWEATYLRELRGSWFVVTYLAAALPTAGPGPLCAAAFTGVPVVEDNDIPARHLRLVYDDGTTRDLEIIKLPAIDRFGEFYRSSMFTTPFTSAPTGIISNIITGLWP